MKGNLIIISSPSGGGKGTLIREVLEHIPEIGYSVSMTTRAPRFGEENGKHYHFVTRERFEQAIANGEFLEYAEVHGNLYGTSAIQTEKMTSTGVDVILEIDVQGAAKVRDKVPDAISIFILPPSYEVLKARLTARATEGSDDLALRLRNSSDEVQQYQDFDYVVVNDDVPTASRKIGAIILAERQRRDRQIETVQGILSSFERGKP
ncbi:MAG TPA: guanylate kinase [Pyrinomonadaceae bacterium]|nr:guanylate kinase [Pyrinomonadaceae bacterium]